MAKNSQYTKAFTTLLTFALVAAGCTKKRDAALPDMEALQTFAISEFGTTNDSYQTSLKPSVRQQSGSTLANKASEEKGLVAVDADKSLVPARLRFMFNNLEVSGQSSDNFKIVFGVDSKFVTAYKLTQSGANLSALEKQLAVTPDEVQASFLMQRSKDAAAIKKNADAIARSSKARVTAFKNRANIAVLVPLFKYEIKGKGVLERTKNEMRESTSTLTLRETEFSEATHIKIDTTSDARKDVGGVEQKKDLDQLYTMESLDNKTMTAADLQNRYNIKMKFVDDSAKVLTKLDAADLKVYEVIDSTKLTDDEKRQLNSGRANGEILRCSDNVSVQSTDKNCVARLVATVPVTYKNLSLNLADKRDNTSNTLQMDKVTKAEAQGLVEIVREARAERSRPEGKIDPLQSIKISDLKGDFYFRRTFEDASNMLLVGKTGTSGELSVVRFELEKDRLVIRNQKALITYAGQNARDNEQIMSVPVKYFKLETTDADGVQVQVAKLIPAVKEDAEYLEIDWTKNTIPVTRSPLAFFEFGECIAATSSQNVGSMDMRLATDGILNFSLEGSYTLKPDCANIVRTNSAYFELKAQFNYDVTERISFKKKTDANDDIQFAPNISPQHQDALNFAIFTLADMNTKTGVRPGRTDSQIYKPVIHDFRNGKVLNYWIGGLENAPSDRRELITKATQEVVAEWNAAFHRVFKGTALDRAGEYIVLKTEDDSNRGHLGDLDRNYLWFMDKETENGLLGVAQPAPNPYSGTIVANNVIVYSGNSEKEVRGFIDAMKETQKYEALLEQAKSEALAEFQKQIAEQQKAEAAGASVPASLANNKVAAGAADAKSYLKKVSLAARPPMITRMSSKYAAATQAKKALTIKSSSVNRLNLVRRNKVSEAKITSNKDFTRSVIQQALQGDFKNDPAMLEAIIAKELARTEPGMSASMKSLLQQKAATQELSARFDKASRQLGGCFLYSRQEYNGKFLNTSFEELFKKEIKATLSHEVGHALGLVHNFKGSYDRNNFAFEDEKGDKKTDRDYSSIMDYLASTEMGYNGPGPYDVHALRAIYTGVVEVSDAAKKKFGSSGVVETKDSEGNTVASAKLIDGKYLTLDQVRPLLGLQYDVELTKQAVNSTGLMKYYGQCNDGQVGDEPACTPYDSGVTASDIVRNAIQDYNRSYMTNYHASDRLSFGMTQKITIIRRNIERFQSIRGVLDDYFKMLIFQSFVSKEELEDFKQASYIGYDFFHTLIRTPDTKLPYGSTDEEIKQRLIPVPMTLEVPVTQKDASGEEKLVKDAEGNVKTQKVPEIKIVEARATYDIGSVGDRINTLGIGYDKAFAVEFLMSANPSANTDDSHPGYISYNEFEKYFLGVNSAAESLNMRTIFEIMTGSLKAGFVSEDHQVQSLDMSAKINQTMLDNATVSALASTNAVQMAGLDSFAEFFKVGTLKGGQDLKNRTTVGRYGHEIGGQSAGGVKFFGPDNAVGGAMLVAMAARKDVFISNKEELVTLMDKMLSADLETAKGVMAERAKDPKKESKDIIAANPTIKASADKANGVAADLVKLLNKMNAKGTVITPEEIKANANLALETQVQMLRNMLLKNRIFFEILVNGLAEKSIEENKEAIQQLASLKQTNAQLADLELFGLGQEYLGKTLGQVPVTLKGQGQIPGSAITSLMVDDTAFTATQENLMYVIEDLAKYTRMLNPEYTY